MVWCDSVSRWVWSAAPALLNILSHRLVGAVLRSDAWDVAGADHIMYVSVPSFAGTTIQLIPTANLRVLHYFNTKNINNPLAL